MNLYTRLVSLPLRVRLLAGFLMSVVPVFVIAVFAYVQNSRSTTQASYTLIEQLSRERVSTVVNALAAAEDTTARIANDNINVFDFSKLVAAPDDGDAQKQVSDVLRQVLDTQPNFRQIRFVSTMGRVLVSLPPATNADDSKQAYFQALKDQLPTAPTNDVYIGDFVESGSVSTQDFVSVAVSGRQPLGFVVVTADVANSADVDVPSVYKSLNAVNTPVGTINFYLLNPNGTVLSPSLHVSTVKPEDQQIIKRLQAGGSQAALEYTSPITGSLSVGAAVPVGGTGLTLIGEIPSQPLGAAQGAQGFLLALLAVVVVCVFVLTLTAVLLNATLVRPLLHLVPLANQAARGQVLDDPDALNQRDEIGQLYTDFKTIATRMKQEHQDLEARVAQRTDSLDGVRAIGQTVSAIREVEPLLKQAVTMLQARFDQLYYVQVFLADAKQEFAVLRVSCDHTGKVVVTRGQQISVQDQAVMAQVIEHGQPLVTRGASSGSQDNGLVPGARAQLALPLNFEGATLGALDLESQRPDAFAQADIDIYSMITDQLAIAINNAVLFENTQTRLNDYESRNRELLGEAWQSFTDTRRRILAQSGQENGEYYEWTELQRQAVESNDIVEQIVGDKVTFAVPVSLRGQVLGAVEWDVPLGSYNENARQLARELAIRLAVSADNARLFEEAQRIAQRERLVNEIASKLTQQTDVSEILKTAVREVGQALHVPQTSIRIATSSDDKPDKPQSR